MYNDKKTSLDKAIAGFWRPVSTDTRVTIKHSDLFPLSDKVTDLLGKVCLKAREVVEAQVNLTPMKSPNQAPWVKAVLKTHLGAKTGMGSRDQELGDGAELIRRWTKVLERVRAGLNKEYNIADLRPRLFLEWLQKHEEAGTNVLGDLVRVKVFPGFMVGDEPWPQTVASQSNYRAELKTLLSDWAPDVGSIFEALVGNTDDEVMRLTYRKIFLQYVENSKTAGSVRSEFPKDAEKKEFTGWKKAPELEGYRKPMIDKSRSISMHFGRLERLADQGDRGLWSAVKTLIHEASHKFAGTLDYAYIHEAGYKTLTMPQAVNNADSFAFAALSNFGKTCITEADLA